MNTAEDKQAQLAVDRALDKARGVEVISEASRILTTVVCVLLTAVICGLPVGQPLHAGDVHIFADVVATTKARCVSISTDHPLDKRGLEETPDRPSRFRCSGVIVEKDLVLTSSHVHRHGTEILVNGKPAWILKRSRRDDLLLLGVETEDLPRVRFREISCPFERVFYVSNSRGRIGAVFGGRVMKVDGEYVYCDCFKQIGQAMGASGSGLYSIDGMLIGIKKGMLARSGPALSVAIPAHRIRRFLEKNTPHPAKVTTMIPEAFTLSLKW